MLKDNQGLVPDFFVDLVNLANDKVFPYSRGPSHFSTTGLSMGPLEMELSRRLTADKSVFDAIAALDGTMLHYGMEQAALLRNDVTERRLYRIVEVNGKRCVVSGSNDHQTSKSSLGNVLTDWKRTKAYAPMYAKKDSKSSIFYDGEFHKEAWLYQLNVNKWLAASSESFYYPDDFAANWPHLFVLAQGRKATPEDFADHEFFVSQRIPNEPFRADRLFIGAFLKDWDQKKANQKPDYPQTVVTFVEQPHMPFEEVEDYIKDRIAYLDGYADTSIDDIPLCSDKERWKDEDVYKVYDTTSKAINPQSRGNSATLAEAEGTKAEWEAKNKHKHRIEFFEGGYPKCVKYCDMRFHCRFGKTVAEDQWEVNDNG